MLAIYTLLVMRCKKNIFFSFLAAGFCPKNLAFAEK